MQGRKRGGQFGNSNAIKHGRFSAPLKAERRAKRVAEWTERERKSAEWMASQPQIDYAAICDAIARSKPRS